MSQLTHYCTLLTVFVGLFCYTNYAALAQENPFDWEQHDTERPAPPVVDPGPAPAEPAPVPADAIVLFDGTDASEWVHAEGEPAQWSVENGYMETVPGTGDIRTTREFGDIQLHIEWAAPEEATGSGQGRGNSGVFLMTMYEVQVLDSYDNPTYPDGQAGSIYGQYPPLVNAIRPPGEWNSYDIIWRRPHFDENGNVEKPARVTVLHNGVLIQDNVELTGPSGHYQRPPYSQHADRLPISLQDHSDPVRFRNIWVRELE